MIETLNQLDQQLLLYLNSFHSPFWDSFMWIFTGKLTWVPMYAAILYVLWKNLKPMVCLFTVIAVVLTITYGDQLCATVIRPIVQRMRPSNPNNPISELVHIVNGKRGGRYGFPSCHAANSFALAFFVMLLFRDKLLTTFILLWATLNSYSRIYIGVHYAGDLLAGMLVGLSGALIVYGLFRYALTIPQIARLIKYNEPDKERIRHQSPFKEIQGIGLTGLAVILIITLYSWFKEML